MSEDEIVVDHPHPRFKIHIPLGFRELPKEFLINYPDWLYGFIEKDKGENFFESLTIGVQRMRGVIGRYSETGIKQIIGGAKKYLPPDTVVKNEKASALGFHLTIMTAYFNIQDTPIVYFVAQIPLEREAIQLIFMGPLSRENELREVMQGTLASIEGKSNWFTDYERSHKLGESVGYLVGIIIVFIIIREKKKQFRKEFRKGNKQ